MSDSHLECSKVILRLTSLLEVMTQKTEMEAESLNILQHAPGKTRCQSCDGLDSEIRI